jgi:hypothetical protein
MFGLSAVLVWVDPEWCPFRVESVHQLMKIGAPRTWFAKEDGAPTEIAPSSD